MMIPDDEECPPDKNRQSSEFSQGDDQGRSSSDSNEFDFDSSATTEFQTPVFEYQPGDRPMNRDSLATTNPVVVQKEDFHIATQEQDQL